MSQLREEMKHDSVDFSDASLPNKVLIYVYAQTTQDAEMAESKIRKLVEEKYRCETLASPQEEDDITSLVSEKSILERLPGIRVYESKYILQKVTETINFTTLL